MKIPSDTTCIIEFLVEALFEESYEMMDYKVIHSVVDVDTLIDFEDTDLAEFMDLDDNGIFVILDSGVYKFKVAYNASTSEFTKLTEDKLSEEEAKGCFSDIEVILQKLNHE